MKDRTKISTSEGEVIATYVEFLEQTNQGRFLIDEEKPDVKDRRRKAPDYSISDPSNGKKVAIEITSLFKSTDAGHGTAIWMEVFGGLDEELRNRFQGSAWLHFPEVGQGSPGFQKRADRQKIRATLIQALPAIISTASVSPQPKRIELPGLPFHFLLRKSKPTGWFVALSRLTPTSQSANEVAKYLRGILPGKDLKFAHPDFQSHQHVILLDDQISFAEDNLAQRALDLLASEVSLTRTDRIFLVGFGRVTELVNPWVTVPE